MLKLFPNSKTAVGGAVPPSKLLSYRIIKKTIIIAVVAVLLSVPSRAAETPQNNEDGFAAWVMKFKAEAIKKGISEETFTEAFENIKYNEKVIALDRRQTEFTLGFWDYLDRMVNNAKINTGRNLYKKHRELLQKIEAKYGVPGNYIVAFWGIESNFGIHFGGFNVIEALATLSYDQRRPELFKEELLQALKIVEKNGIAPKDMKGSWAGAMGHFQFLPSTYNAYAVDFDGDGKKDIWNSLPDAFASAANYLGKMGWKRRQKWGREVYLPDNLSWVRLNRKLTRPIGEWKKAEIVPADKKGMLGMAMEATIIFPGGYKGPVFLTYPNFEIIKRWNRSNFYAVAVGHFSDRIIGGGKLITKRLKLYVPSKDEIKEAQQALADLGFYSGKVDGLLGKETREGIRIAQQKFDLPIDGYLSKELLKKMRKRK